MGKITPLSFQEQLELFAARGLSVKNEDVKKLEHISYYRLKEFARPLSTTRKINDEIHIDYSDVSFSEILTRYYQDKNLRINLLHAIEKIEVSLKTKTSFILGNHYGPFGYLDFSKWVNKQANSKFFVEEKQFYFKKDLKKSINKSNYSDVKSNKNKNKEGFPTVWLSIDILMFGNIINLIELMNVKLQNELASFYSCSRKELISWLKCLNLIRNLCAHNSNIIDIKLKTTPIVRNEWEKNLYQISDNRGNKRLTNRLAIVFCIAHHMVSMINKHYKWNNLSNNVFHICQGSEKKSNLLGFKDFESAKKVFKNN